MRKKQQFGRKQVAALLFMRRDSGIVKKVNNFSLEGSIHR
jgi:hypothetical protein